MRSNEQPATYEQIHKALLTGLLGNIGCKGVDQEPYYLGAREIKFFIASNSVLAKKGTKWVVAAETGRDDQVVCALCGAYRTGMAGRSRRASDQAQLFRCALGEEGGAGGGMGTQHVVRAGHQSRRSACITGR